MEAIILDQIPFEPNFEEAAKIVKLRPETRGAEDFKALLDTARPFARPKAMFKVVPVELRGEDQVVCEETIFYSRILHINLSSVQRAFPFVVTCGIELYEWKMSLDDMLTQYYAEMVNAVALYSAIEFFINHLEKTYRLGNTSSMNPGSLEDWPINEQTPLFELLGDPEKTIGVQLMESLLMVPNQSVSGIRFENEKNYTNCELCPMDGCPSRKALYDMDLYSDRYA